MSADDAQVELARRELVWRNCQRDVLAATQFWHIQHPLGSRLWSLYDAQREILTSWATRQNHIHLKARQIGFSTSVAYYSFWGAFFGKERKILLISKTERDAAELLDKVLFGYDRLPEWMLEHGPQPVSRTQSSVKFDNGSEILSLPSASDPARGYTGWLVVVDEMAFLTNQESAWASINPVAERGGQIIGLSTANGQGNMFHKLWEKAVAGVSDFKAMFYPWWAVPDRNGEWYEKTRSGYLDWQMAQEYPSNPEEAFIKSGATVFDPDMVMGLAVYPPMRCEFNNSPSRKPTYDMTVEGRLRVWEPPIKGESYVIGADVAEGLETGDASSAHVLKVSDRSLVAHWHGRIDADMFGEELVSLGFFYNTALICPESNGHGLTTITILKQRGYPRLFRNRSLGKVGENVSDAFGVKTTRGSKPHIIDTLNRWLREDPTMPCVETKGELSGYVRSSTGKMQGSPHDDRVMSLAFAVLMLEYATVEEYRQVVDDSGTMDWVERTLLGNSRTRKGNRVRPMRVR